MDPDSLNDVIVKAEDVFSLDQQNESDANEENPWSISQQDDYGKPHSNIISSEFSEPNKEENSSLYTSFPVYEYIMHQTKLQSENEPGASNLQYTHTNRINVLLVSLDKLIKDVRTLVENTCSIYPNDEVKPIESNLELDQN